MSAYIQFFIRGNDDKLYPILNRSRNTVFARHFRDVPYEEIMPVDCRYLQMKVYEIEAEIEKEREDRDRCERRIDFLMTAEMPSSEKMEVFNDYLNEMEDIEDDIKLLQSTITELNLLWDMVEEATSYGDYSDPYLYCGWEVNPNKVKFE